MLKIKSILNEQYGVKKFVIQTPAPQSIIDIVRKTTPQGAGFILKSTAMLGEEPSMGTIVGLIKLDPEFGENSIWAKASFTNELENSYVYLLGPDQKDAQRKTKFNVMIVPKSYIIDTVLGTEATDEAKRTAVYNELVTVYSIGEASVMMQSELDELKNKIAPSLDKEQLKKLEAENAELKKALAAKNEPAPTNQTVVTTNSQTTSSTETQKSKTESLLDRLTAEPIVLNTKSDDVAYIQDLIYRIGMATPAFGSKNDYPEWVAFRDAKSQYGTYGTRTYNFLKFLGFTAATTATDSITADVLRKILDAGKKIGITESLNTKLIKKLFEQFVVPEPASTVVSDLKKDAENKTQLQNKTTYGSFHPIGTSTSKLDYKTPIKYGSKGEEVKQMQVFINGILAASGKASQKISEDGNFGPGTLKAHNGITTKALALGDWAKQFANAKEIFDKSKQSNITNLEMQESKEMDKIWQDAYDVLVRYPEKYFAKFSKWYNDKEVEAADWLVSAWTKAWGEKLKQLKKSKSTYIQNNVKNIEYTVNYIANKLIRAGYSGRVKTTYWYLDKNNKWKSQPLTFEWKYM